MSMKIKQPKSVVPEIRLAEKIWGANISGILREHLKELVQTIGISVAAGDIQLIDGRWYVTHAGLLSLARRKRCNGIQTAAITEFCDRRETTAMHLRPRFSLRVIAKDSLAMAMPTQAMFHRLCADQKCG
jgi:hypothetical protein